VTLIEIDEKFTFYSSIVETLANTRKYQDIKCVRINLQPLLESITQHAKDWCTTLGEELLRHVNDNMRAMRNEIKVSLGSARFRITLSYPITSPQNTPFNLCKSVADPRPESQQDHTRAGGLQAGHDHDWYGAVDDFV